MKSINIILILIASCTVISYNATSSFAKEYNQKIVSQSFSEEFNRQLTCLAENVYYEASFEPYENKLAVAQVTMNRSNSRSFPSNICDVVKQKKNGVCQFSWVCNTHSIIRNKYEWEEAEIIARKALMQKYVHEQLYNQQSMFYHATYVDPNWNKVRLIQIGKHIYYK
jgi:N-acetylmuramoyl-L-alanine amidase